MQVTAHLSRLQMSPRKVRLIGDVLQDMDVDVAEAQLKHLPQVAARPILKLMQSAIANATHNFSLDRSNLFVRQVRVDQGPTLRRYRPRAFGRAAKILKRSSHVTVVLDERVPTPESKAKKAKQDTVAPVVVERQKDAMKKELGPGKGQAHADGKDRHSETGGKKQDQGFFRNFLQRKSGKR
jgi:large subunit ribosomal protein L22